MIAEIAVVVPARDEQQVIGRCLAALAVAVERVTARSAVRVRTVVVLDDCRDDTARVVARRAAVDTLVVGGRCVGAARAAGTAHLLLAAGVPADAVWTAHTDADSQVPAHWLTSMLDAADAGADAVLGTVVPGDGLRPPVRAAWHAAHPMGEDHPYVHGANFGVRASTYLAVGGWNALGTHEDVELAARLDRAGATVVRTALAPVTTSSRRSGRVVDGFADYLGALDAGPASA